MVLWAETHQEWLGKYVDIDSGIPSYSTIRRLFTLIKPAYWGQLLHHTLLEHHPNKKVEDHIPIDGKRCGEANVPLKTSGRCKWSVH